MEIHVVRPGDTLASIATEYGVPLSLLRSDNQLPDPDRLVTGQTIVVYVNKGELSRAIGHKKKNKLRLIEIFSLKDICFKEASLPEGTYVSLFE